MSAEVERACRQLVSAVHGRDAVKAVAVAVPIGKNLTVYASTPDIPIASVRKYACSSMFRIIFTNGVLWCGIAARCGRLSERGSRNRAARTICCVFCSIFLTTALHGL